MTFFLSRQETMGKRNRELLVRPAIMSFMTNTGCLQSTCKHWRKSFMILYNVFYITNIFKCCGMYIFLIMTSNYFLLIVLSSGSNCATTTTTGMDQCRCLLCVKMLINWRTLPVKLFGKLARKKIYDIFLSTCKRYTVFKLWAWVNKIYL